MMSHHEGRNVGVAEPKDPYYYMLVGVTTLAFLMMLWALTPWFPWK